MVFDTVKIVEYRRCGRYLGKYPDDKCSDDKCRDKSGQATVESRHKYREKSVALPDCKRRYALDNKKKDHPKLDGL